MIGTNVAVLCMYHDGIDPGLETTLGVLETLFLVRKRAPGADDAARVLAGRS